MNGEFASAPYNPIGKSSGPMALTDGFYSPELRGEFKAGLLDLHAMDDTEFLSEHVLSESFEPSPFMPILAKSKTFTMQPLPIRAVEDIVRLLHHPIYRNQRFKLWLSFLEIYGGKLYDLLSDRRKLFMREDGRLKVFIVGLQEFEVADEQIVQEYIEKGNAVKSTGSIGANEESSRSHALL
ncbi:hypothetical protein GIB67_042467 [Kingdonia uniflora]|uniref:Kinesin motor domain-containing protein n=1 Tax=Kingdonia uniflora TaxID=39325 RepID=A0A7J7M150_9MAGN|nr:hypothetical protein GIB67_042467 [Kingdonia uniflora]